MAHGASSRGGGYDGRSKLTTFYDLDEWELDDLKTDPKEIQNQIENPEYAEVVQRMRAELKDIRAAYDVSVNTKQNLSNIDMRYPSAERRKRAPK